MAYSRRVFFPALLLITCLGRAAQAVPVDTDFETVVPAHSPAPTTPMASLNPPGFAGSPLVLADHPSGPFPRMRFVLCDGSVMVGQVLGFDGQMYAVRLPHETVLARRDFFVSMTPIPAGDMHKQSVRPAHTSRSRVGARS